MFQGVYANPNANLILNILTLAVFGLTAWFVSMWLIHKWGGKKKVVYPVSIGLILAVTAGAILTKGGFTMRAIKGPVFGLIALSAAYEDICKHECHDWHSVMVLLTALIGTDAASLPRTVAAGLAVGIVLCVFLLLSSDTIGGADVKMAAASSCFIGSCAASVMQGCMSSLIALAVGLLASVIVSLILKRGRKQKYPLLPYLAVAYMLIYFI